MNAVLREASLDDAQLLADLTRAAWRDTVAVTSSGHRETALQAAAQLQRGGAFILMVDDMPAGSVRWLPQEGDDHVWEILRMGVLPAYRGHQLSQHLLEAVVHHAQGCGVEELRLAVRADASRLLDLYAAHGFELAPELDYAHANPLEPMPMVMRCRLRR
jgi:ribosomal protein S18 acetylase RimI-like enzyme